MERHCENLKEKRNGTSSLDKTGEIKTNLAETQGAFLVETFYTRQSRFEWATRSLAHTAHSVHRLTLFTGSLTHFAHSLLGQWKLFNLSFHTFLERCLLTNGQTYLQMYKASFSHNFTTKNDTNILMHNLKPSSHRRSYSIILWRNKKKTRPNTQLPKSRAGGPVIKKINHLFGHKQ